MPDRRRIKGSRRVAAAAAALLAAGTMTATAEAASTVTVAPNTPNANNSFPFGQGAQWIPYMGFVYKNVPPFQLKANDIIAFDLGAVNDADDQLDIAMASTTVNGGDVPSGAFTPVVSNTQTPASPRGNTVQGDYELRYTAQAPFNFGGGGLIIRFSNPGTQLAGDLSGTPVLQNGGQGIDSSGLFVERFYADPDGVYPWTGPTPTDEIGAFRLEILDVPPTSATNTPSPVQTGQRAAALKKCKKKFPGKAKAKKRKKCKKKANLLPV